MHIDTITSNYALNKAHVIFPMNDITLSCKLMTFLNHNLVDFNNKWSKSYWHYFRNLNQNCPLFHAQLTSLVLVMLFCRLIPHRPHFSNRFLFVFLGTTSSISYCLRWSRWTRQFITCCVKQMGPLITHLSPSRMLFKGKCLVVTLIWGWVVLDKVKVWYTIF